MKYSKRFKESVLKKVLPPENKSVPEVAREMGISAKENEERDFFRMV